jgi:replicative DNA helicase Mcm
MAATSHDTTGPDATEDFREFFGQYNDSEIAALAQRYPGEQRSLYVDYDDLFVFDHELAERFRTMPEATREDAERALREYELPADVALTDAHVRVYGHPPDRTYYPGHYPDDLASIAGTHLAIEGQLSRATDTYAKLTEAAFECQRCRTTTDVPQADGYQEPHECQGCERQGPFGVNFDDSAFVDEQKLRIEEPPEIAKGGDGAHIDVYLDDDAVEAAEPGDKVVISGVFHLEQTTENNSKTARFEPYLDGRVVQRKEAEFEDIKITDDDEDTIHAVAEHGLEDDDRDIFELAVDSIARGIVGEDDVKEAIFLQLVSGVRTTMPDDTVERGDIHQLLIGDPSTAKSQLMDAAEELAPRAVSVSGHGATASGLTAAAVRDDFGASEWTLEAGALVHANHGLACIDELDKVADEALNSMHKAMAQQRIPVNKAGINATLPSETAVLAAANPSGGRWDPYDPKHEQIDVDSALLSRFGLVWCFEDQPDRERDAAISESVLLSKDVAKRMADPDATVGDDETAKVAPPLKAGFLRKYIAYARQQYQPAFRDDGVREELQQSFVQLRTVNGTDEEAPIPVTMRKLQDVHRLAEAAARARLSPVIEEQDVERAQRLIGASIREFGMNEDGDLDADVVETGTSKPQQQRMQQLRELIIDEQPDNGDPLPLGELQTAAKDELDLDTQVTKRTVDSLCERGEAYRPESGCIRVFK